MGCLTSQGLLFRRYAAMGKSTAAEVPLASPTSRDVLTEILREGAQRMLATAIESEAAAWIEAHQGAIDNEGRRQVVRNGHLPPRKLVTGVGPVEVKQPRVHDRRPESQREVFSSKILPKYLRKTKAIEALIPWLYLKGISTGDMMPALEALVGPGAAGLSPAVITKLKSHWEGEFKTWSQRPLTKRYLYVWADGVYFNIRLEDDRQCILVLMGAAEDGTKELIALADGFRESEQSWTALLLSCKARGLTHDPKLATGDGALGFWAAVRKIFPTTREQRCWVHKTANILDKMPKHIQGQAKDAIHQIWMAEGRAKANEAFDQFVKTYQAKYPQAVECLTKDRDELLAFYDFPAEHWIHIRTTNPIESTFATVRLRTRKTKGCGSRIACLSMVFKLMECASKTWRSLNGSNILKDVIAGVKFVDGVRVAA